MADGQFEFAALNLVKRFVSNLNMMKVSNVCLWQIRSNSH